MVGKRFSSDDEVLARLRRLEHRVDAVQLGTGTTNVTNITETGVENFVELGDVPQTFVGATGEFPYVNAAEDGLEFNPYVTVSPTAPILTVRNMTDAAVDPVREWAVGAIPVVMFTHGIDVSDAHKLKWCNTTTLVDTCIGGGTWGDNLIIADYGNNRIKNHIASTLVYYSEAAVTDPQCTCSDGTNYYVTFPGVHLVKKFLIATDALVWTIGDVAGSGDDQFDDPQGICTDGTYLYIVDKGNCRIKKHLCLTGAYIDKVGVYGTGLGQFITPSGICTDDVHLYITEGAPGAGPLLKKHLCSTLVGVAQISADGHLDTTNCQGICTDGINLFLINMNNAATNAVFKYTLSLTWVSDYGAVGTGDTQFATPFGICTDAIYLYIMDTGNSRIKKHLVSDYSFDSKVGSFGSGDDQFAVPRGICIAYISVVEERTGQLLVLHPDGKFYDVYPKLSLYNHLVFREDSVAAANAIEITAPVTVVSYTITLPGIAPGAKKHLFSVATNILDWGQNVDTDASPEFAGLTLTGFSGILKATVGVISGGAVVADLADVYFPSGEPDIGDVLTYESGGWTSMPAGGTMVLDDLTDVDAPAPNDLDVLTWDVGSGLWIPAPAPGGPIAFADLTDYPADAVGVLTNDGAGALSWGPGGGAMDLDDLTDVDAITGLSDQDVLTWDVGSGLWIALPAPGGSSYPLFSADAFPVSPTSESDHFDDDVVTGWTAFNPGAYTQSVAESDHHLKITRASDAGEEYAGYFKAFPGGVGNFTITAKLYAMQTVIGANYCGIALALFEDATNNPATSDLLVHGIRLSSGMTRFINANRWTAYNAWGGNYFAGTPSDYLGVFYLRIRRNGTTLYLDYSCNGMAWMNCYSVAQPFTPAEFGFLTHNYGTRSNFVSWIDWIYYEGADNVLPLGRVI